MRNNLIKTGFKKVAIGLVVVIIMALFNVIVGWYIIQGNKDVITKMTEVTNPYLATLEEFNVMVTESKMYITNWVYLKSSEADKRSLVELHERRYPDIKKKLNSYLLLVNNPDQTDTLKKVFQKFEKLLIIENSVMTDLVTFDDYENPVKKFTAEDIIETEVLARTAEIQSLLKSIIGRIRLDAEKAKNDMVASFNRLMTITLGIGVGLFIIVLLASAFISRSISEPVLRIKNIVTKLGKGELPEEKLSVSQDVIGEMISSVNALSENFSKTTLFANEIEKGNFSMEFNPLSEKDKLGNALVSMRSSLKSYSENMEQQVAERTKEVMEKSAKLEVAYSEIKDSISYAKRIQEAILPSKELIKKIFPDSFIFYKPKDIVSGDFYWFADKGDFAIIGVIDCTGHGVPGALMTVVGNSLMNHVVNGLGITEPAEILTELDKRVQETLNQHGQRDTNDGMDAAICKYDKVKKELTFAGAKRPLMLFRNKSPMEMRGNPFPIGSFQYEGIKKYTQQTIQLNPKDMVYIFTDGYQDQFGGLIGKKFMIKKMREMLIEICTLKMVDQHLLIEQENTNWTGDIEQTDDILVIGLRFN